MLTCTSDSRSTFAARPRRGHLARRAALPVPVLQLLDLGRDRPPAVVTGGDGVRRDVVLGLPDPAALLASTDYIGGTIGRYANRIAGGRFALDGQEVEVSTHDRGNHLHGGPDGFDRQLWTVEAHGADYVRAQLVSPDGDQGFPGEVTARARFAVTADGVELELTAPTTRRHGLNLTSHAYFNLDGDGSASTTIGWRSSRLVHPGRRDRHPACAATRPVDGTPFDLRKPDPDRRRRPPVHPQLVGAGVSTTTTCFDGAGWRRTGRAGLAGTAHPRLEVWSDQPGLQVYTGNFLDGSSAVAPAAGSGQGDGIALEPQVFRTPPTAPASPTATCGPARLYSSRGPRATGRFSSLDVGRRCPRCERSHFGPSTAVERS